MRSNEAFHTDRVGGWSVARSGCRWPGRCSGAGGYRVLRLQGVWWHPTTGRPDGAGTDRWSGDARLDRAVRPMGPAYLRRGEGRYVHVPAVGRLPAQRSLGRAFRALLGRHAHGARGHSGRLHFVWPVEVGGSSRRGADRRRESHGPRRQDYRHWPRRLARAALLQGSGAHTVQPGQPRRRAGSHADPTPVRDRYLPDGCSQGLHGRDRGRPGHRTVDGGCRCRRSRRGRRGGDAHAAERQEGFDARPAVEAEGEAYRGRVYKGSTRE